MRLQERALPGFEAPASYEKYAQEGVGTQGDGKQNALDVFDSHVKHMEQMRDQDLGFEAQVDMVVTCIGAQGSLREILYKTLVFCMQEQSFDAVEAFISKTDEYVYGNVIQTPYSIAKMLVRAGGLAQTYLDCKGNPIDERLRETLTQDELDDIIESSLLATTEAGAQAVELVSPEHRIEVQLAQHPHRLSTYLALMEFCSEPRTFPQIQEFFDTTPDLARDIVADHHKLSPDFYVDKLDKAGALVWRGAWVITEQGKRALAQRKAA